MLLSLRFRFVLAVALVATLSLKILVSGGINNPSFDTIARSVETSMAGIGFETAGIVPYNGAPSALVRNTDCIMYVVPIAQQGWNQASLNLTLAPENDIWYVFEGHVRAGAPDRWRPMLGYYIAKSLRYAGFDTGYPPLLAVIAPKACPVASIDWSAIKDVHFESSGWIGGDAAEYPGL